MKAALIFLFVLWADVGFSREFYRTEFSIGARYSNLDYGSVNLFGPKFFVVHFSDDAAFCLIYDRQNTYPCVVVSPYNSRIKIAGSDLAELFSATLAASVSIDESIRSSFGRLIVGLRSREIEPGYGPYDIQLHDAQPESLHVLITGFRNTSRL